MASPTTNKDPLGSSKRGWQISTVRCHMATLLPGTTGSCTSPSKLNSPTSEIITGVIRDSRLQRNENWAFNTQTPEIPNQPQSCLLAHIPFWFSGTYRVIASQLLFICCLLQMIHFLFCFINSTLLSTNHSIKTFKVAALIISVDLFGTRKKIINLYGVGSPQHFKKVVLYICIVPVYSLVPA